ncbi:MAG: hypothetical protein K6T29_02935 [Peptococcaceae bacterium]|nr:hypothetical protein [Peptococcaceae bacterium]
MPVAAPLPPACPRAAALTAAPLTVPLSLGRTIPASAAAWTFIHALSPPLRSAPASSRHPMSTSSFEKIIFTLHVAAYRRHEGVI